MASSGTPTKPTPADLPPVTRPNHPPEPSQDRHPRPRLQYDGQSVAEMDRMQQVGGPLPPVKGNKHQTEYR